MTVPDAAALLDAVEGTWPPAASSRVGPFTVRDGAGGGKRVSAATAEGPATDADLDRAEAAMAALGQEALFMLRPWDSDLDARLDGRGYRVVDPVVIYATEPGPLADQPIPRVAAFTLWPPLAIQARLWAAGGIGPARLAVMDRAPEPKAALLARTADRPAGSGFCAIHDGIAMIHALEVAPDLRRRGAGANMIRAAARWAVAQGAHTLALAVTEANVPARALYERLGFRRSAAYHYRAWPEA